MMNRSFKIFILYTLCMTGVVSAVQVIYEVRMSPALESGLWRLVNSGKTVAYLPPHVYKMLGFLLYKQDPRAEAIFNGLYKNQTGAPYYNADANAIDDKLQ